VDQSPSPERPRGQGGTLQWIGTATVLVRYGPFAVLTDPNFLHKGQHAYLGRGLTARRLTEPALQPDQLPPLDVVVLSHLHGDHWDRVARRSLDRETPIVTTPHASRRLQAWHGFHRALGLRTWTSHTLTKDGATLKITAMPGRHAHGAIGAVLPPVMGSMLEFTSQTGEPPSRST
jgi:L-ascorbate metabolism protein UlaG (beta-lactamase superfamily)